MAAERVSVETQLKLVFRHFVLEIPLEVPALWAFHGMPWRGRFVMGWQWTIEGNNALRINGCTEASGRGVEFEVEGEIAEC